MYEQPESKQAGGLNQALISDRSYQSKVVGIVVDFAKIFEQE